MQSVELTNILLGVFIAMMCIWLFRIRDKRKEIILWGHALMIAAIVYLIFSFFQNSWKWIALEIGGISIYSALVFGGKRVYLQLISLGWILHVLWDVILHIHFDPGYAPRWYPNLCIGFDIPVAGYVYWLVRKHQL